ncbi:hypothetical protein B0H13DRAFT_1890716 [Mycena leptocephala]|nr:hypothetical protein B0H13DRAFT_1890716 [Mycena leptocephala]
MSAAAILNSQHKLMNLVITMNTQATQFSKPEHDYRLVPYHRYHSRGGYKDHVADVGHVSNQRRYLRHNRKNKNHDHNNKIVSNVATAGGLTNNEIEFDEITSEDIPEEETLTKKLYSAVKCLVCQVQEAPDSAVVAKQAQEMFKKKLIVHNCFLAVEKAFLKQAKTKDIKIEDLTGNTEEHDAIIAVLAAPAPGKHLQQALTLAAASSQPIGHSSRDCYKHQSRIQMFSLHYLHCNPVPLATFDTIFLLERHLLSIHSEWADLELQIAEIGSEGVSYKCPARDFSMPFPNLMVKAREMRVAEVSLTDADDMAVIISILEDYLKVS